MSERGADVGTQELLEGEGHTAGSLLCFLHVSVPCHPHLGTGEMDTYLAVVGFEFSRCKVLPGKMSD